MQTINPSLELYSRLGFDTLPLKPGTKEALSKEWPRLSPEIMWETAPSNSNLGIRAGGTSKLAVLDCDDKEEIGTLGTISRWLDGIGYSPGTYPLVETASGLGGHIYTIFTGELEGNYWKLSRHIGSGEFRYGQGAYVVGPPSKVNNRTYQIIDGDLHFRPSLDKNDVAQLFDNNNTLVTQNKSEPFHRSGSIPRKTFQLINGMGLSAYSSRSEAEQGIITGLVNSGFDFDEVFSIFRKNPCAGKFKELNLKSPQQGYKWLRNSFEKSYVWANSNESQIRKSIFQTIRWAQANSWLGRTGLNDKLVFLSHANIAYKAGTLTYNASARQLAIASGISPEGTMKSTLRLRELGYVVLVRNAIADRASIYRIECQSMTLPEHLL